MNMVRSLIARFVAVALAVITILGLAMLVPKVGATTFLYRHYGQDAWRLDISTDQFSGDISCRLWSRDGRSHYAANAIEFRIGGHISPIDGTFRIDNGAPLKWRDQLPELARLHAAIEGGDSDPATGTMLLPVTLVAHGEDVAIQTRPGKRPRRFSLKGFRPLYDYARSVGCLPEARRTS